MLALSPAITYDSFIGSKQPKETEMSAITRQNVVQAAAESGVGILEALSLMQSAAAQMGDERTLSRLCQIKSEILFGED